MLNQQKLRNQEHQNQPCNIVELSVDLISDLNLEKSEQFDWTGKPTSLFCAIAGNISNDISRVKETLEHLGSLYRGVFYIDGQTEHKSLLQYDKTVEKLSEICKPLQNVIYMQNHVVVLNNIAFVAINGWQNYEPKNPEESFLLDGRRNEDLGYLSNSLRNLQLHRDATKIVIISSCIPTEHLFFKKRKFDHDGFEPGLSLIMDTDHKVNHWLYGGTNIVGDFEYNRRRYVNNPKINGQPYWPKRIII